MLTAIGDLPGDFFLKKTAIGSITFLEFALALLLYSPKEKFSYEISYLEFTSFIFQEWKIFFASLSLTSTHARLLYLVCFAFSLSPAHSFPNYLFTYEITISEIP